MEEKPKIPIKLTGDESPDYQPDSRIYMVPNWPDPEVKGYGTVRSKDGKLKDDTHGSDAIECGSERGG